MSHTHLVDTEEVLPEEVLPEEVLPEDVEEEPYEAGESVLSEIKEQVLRNFNHGIVYEEFSLEQLA